MSTAIVIPSDTTGDPWRAKAFEHVKALLEERHPRAEIVVGGVKKGTPWSKGAAVNAAMKKVTGEPDVLVIHDADSFLRGSHLHEAIDLVREHPDKWVTPHKMVYRLREGETERIHANPARAPRKMVTRSPYVGPAGGGITVLSPATFKLVNGIDPRFQGWGGEDIAFGWALDTLGAEHVRLEGQLFHLWHEHPAPDLRGSEESEQLVDRYRGARGFPRRMAELVAGGDWKPLDPVADPVRFRMTANRKTLRIAGHDPMRFKGGTYEASDPDEIEALHRHPYVIEDKRRR